MNNVYKVAAFADGNEGGNPAGVYIAENLPTEEQMQTIATEVGYSETAFAAPEQDGWRVRYFSPESEVPFCGHATIALGAVLAKLHGENVYALALNNANITVEGSSSSEHIAASLQSPSTHTTPASETDIQSALQLFGYTTHDLDERFPVHRANAGAEHLIFVLRSREKLAQMKYDLNDGRTYMRDAGLVTIMFAYAESEQVFHSRNAFASGGVLEDPATGAATAAFAGYLRDIAWPHQNAIHIVQGEDMGSRSLIDAEFSNTAGDSVRISGKARFIE